MIKQFYFLAMLLLLSISGFSQKTITQMYGQQLPNSTFEGGWKESETAGWNSFATAKTMWLTGSAVTQDQSGPNSEIRPGSSGIQSARVNARKVLNIAVANGTLTTGRINAGSATAKDVSKNYNYTIRNDSKYATPFTAKPDSISLWVKFTTSNVDQEAHIAAFLHSNALDFQDAPSRKEDRDNIAGVAIGDFKRSYVNNTATWKRVTVPFKYDNFVSYNDYTNAGPNNEKVYNINPSIVPSYIIVTVSTNRYPGGNENDILLFDDMLMVYKPTLELKQLSSNQMIGGGTFEVPFTLTGTMSPYNLNCDDNVVIAELSNSSGSFANPIELGRVKTDESGKIVCNVPSNMAGTGYKIRVRSTNYPMISKDNGSSLTILGPYTVTIPSNQTGYTIQAISGSTSPVLHGGSYSFRVNLEPSHSNSMIEVKANGSKLTAQGGLYIINNISSNQIITVDGVIINNYAITMPSVTDGYTIVPVSGSALSVPHGSSYSFKINLLESHNNSIPVVRVDDLELNISGGVYTISNVTSNKTVTISNVALNKYSVTLPLETEGYSIVPELGSTSPVQYGGSYSFKVNLFASHSGSKALVKVDGVVLSPNNGIYTINNIMSNKIVTVEGVVINKYDVILPLNPLFYSIVAESGSASPVQYGGNYSFKLILDEEYQDSEVIVKVNGSLLTANAGGVYTIRNITETKRITVEGIEKNEYIIVLPTHIGYTVVAEPGSISPIQHGGSYAFRVNLAEAYSNSEIMVKANGITLTPSSEVYVINNITKEQNITIDNVIKNVYTIIPPAVPEGYTIETVAGSLAVEYGGSYSFRVRLDNSHSESKVVVKVNGAEISHVAGIYTISNIKENKTIVVEGIAINMYAIKLPTNVGYQIIAVDGSVSPIAHGGSYSFRVDVEEAYSNSVSVVTVKSNGTELKPASGVYKIENIAAVQTIVVEGVSKNTYTVTLPTDMIGYEIESVGGSGFIVEYGESYSFKVKLNASHSNSTVKILVNGIELVNQNGIYTISDIKENKSVIVSGIDINKYAVNINNGLGYTIVAEVGSESPVAHGGNYSFRVVIDAAYSNSNITVKVNEKALSDNNGIYTISNITSDQFINVYDVIKNMYDVVWTDVVGATISVKESSVNIANGSKIEHGKSIIVMANNILGYTVEAVVINGVRMENGVSYTVTSATNISVVVSINHYTVNWSNPIGGAIEVKMGEDVLTSGVSLPYNSVIKVSAKADNGYTLGQIKVNGTTFANNGEYRVVGNVVVEVQVTINSYKVSWINPEGCIISVIKDGESLVSGQKVNFGSTISVTANPAESHNISSIIVNGLPFTNGGSHTVGEDVTIVVTTIKKSYMITVIQAENGVITPATIIVDYGDNQTFNINANDNYSVREVLVDGVSVGKRSTYTFTEVKSNHDITATYDYTPDMFNITLPTVSGAVIQPIDGYESPVIEGNDFKFTVSLLSSHNNSVISVKANGQELLPINNVYTVENIIEHKTITVDGVIRNKYAIHWNNDEFVTVTVKDGDRDIINGEMVEHGKRLTISAQTITGYSVQAIEINGNSIDNGGEYIVIAETSINVIKSINSYRISWTNPIGATIEVYNGNVVVDNGTYVPYNTEITIVGTSQDGYEIETISANGIQVENNSIYVVNDNTTIVANTTLRKYPVLWTNPIGATIEVRLNGTSITSGSNIDFGSVLTIFANPYISHNLSSLKVNGEDFPMGGTHTVVGDVNIEATTDIKTYIITVIQPENGSITPTSAVINHGDNKTFTISSNYAYTVKDVIVDGISMGKRNSYTFTNVIAGHTITAILEYTPNMFEIVLPSIQGVVVEAAEGYVPSVIEGEDFKFSVSLLPSHDNSVISVKANEVELVKADDGLYTISNISNRQVITIENVKINSYTVILPNVQGAVVQPVEGFTSTVEYGASFVFTVTLDESHSNSEDKYIVNANETRVYKVDDKYTISNIRSDVNVEVLDVEMNRYRVNLPIVVGATVTPLEGFDPTSVYYGSDFKFEVSLEAAYSNSNYMLFDGSNQLEAVDGVYTIESVKEDKNVYVTNVVKNVYTITIPTITGATINPVSGYDTTVEYGSTFKFTVQLNPSHNNSNPKVYANMQELTVTNGNIYTIDDVKENMNITVSDIELNHYSVILPNIEGATVSPLQGCDPTCVYYGSDFKFEVTLSPAYSQSSVIVSANGIELAANDGVYTVANVKANISVEIANVTINQYSLTATAGENGYISPNGLVTVEYGGSQTFTITANESYHIADVLVNGQSVGAVESYTFDNVTSNQTISATYAINMYEITATAGENGSITPIGTTSVPHGGSQTFTITANESYHIADVLVNGQSVGAVESYTFSNVISNQTISATYVINMYDITALPGENGTITPVGTTSVVHGGSQTYTITANEGYHIADVLVNGSSVGAVESYTFDNVTSNQTISATYAINMYDITATSGENGSITPIGTTSVIHGGSQTYTITANEGYLIADVLVNAQSVGAIESYTFDNVTSNQTISATYTIKTYQITAIAGANGAIAPDGITTVNHGENHTYNITADEGYVIDTILIDGNSIDVSDITTYEFINVTANHTIEVTFREDVGVNNVDAINSKIYAYAMNIFVSADSNVNIDIIDISGKIIDKCSIDNEQHQFSMTQQGVYIVRITHNGKIIKTEKVIVR